MGHPFSMGKLLRSRLTSFRHPEMLIFIVSSGFFPCLTRLTTYVFYSRAPDEG